MCGRYTLASERRTLRTAFQLDALPIALEPHYNIAPGQEVAVVRRVAGLGHHLDLVHWGLIPSWAKDAHIGRHLFNARAETVAEKPAFRAAFHRRRCLIPADGYYEWQRQAHGKQPYWIGFRDHRVFAFAGLWEHWESPDGHPMESCTIITTTANALVAAVCPRMPVILAPQDYGPWLAEQSTEQQRLSLLQPFAPQDMYYYPVSAELNSPLKDNPGLRHPLH